MAPLRSSARVFNHPSKNPSAEPPFAHLFHELLLTKRNNLFFGPEPCLSAVLRNESTMSAVLRGEKSDCRVLLDAGGTDRRVRNERIILSCNQKIRHTNLAHDPSCACTFVIFLRVFEAELRRGNRVVKLSHCSNPPKSV